MNAMSEKGSNIGPNRSSNAVPRLAPYVLWGAVIGVIGGLGTLFATTAYYGQACGLTTGTCVALSCVMTVLLAQPAVLLGLLAGAACGAVCGFVVHWVHHSRGAS
jgi:hypothetical protein